MFFRHFEDKLADRQQERKLRQFREMYKYQPDANGNYPAFFHPRTGTYFAASPGNRPVPEQYFMSVGGARQAIVRTTVINTGRTKLPEPEEGKEDIPEADYQEFEPPAELPSGVAVNIPTEQDKSNLSSKSIVQPEPVRTDAEIRALLTTYREHGRAKVESIYEAAQVKSRSGKKYETYSAFWDSLPKPVPYSYIETKPE